MALHTLDPLTDPRWPEFLSRHPDASIFHTSGWLQALSSSYRYRPIAFTNAPDRTLSNVIVFCEVQSWLTGRRLISLPFSDHCQPLAAGDPLAEILEHLERSRSSQRWRYIELRPLRDDAGAVTPPRFGVSEQFSLQAIDLRPSLETVYQRFHPSCIHRKIKKAERENFTYESGTTEDLLRRFVHLLLLTRRRHQLPPQPVSWFRNILRFVGCGVALHLLSKDSVPAAAMLTLTHGSTLVYKYGCSDASFNNLGAVPSLFWKVIQEAREGGIDTFDLGRSGFSDPGLIAFKEHLGAVSRTLRYQRTPAPPSQASESPGGASALARQAVSRLPDPLFAGVGQMLYRHMA